MPIAATFRVIFPVAKVDVVGSNHIARSNNKKGYRKVAFFVIMCGGIRTHEKVGSTASESRAGARR